MSFQDYLDTIKAKTGKTPEDFRRLAEEKGLLQDGVKSSPIVAWLKEEFGLGQGHGMAIVMTMKDAIEPKLSVEEQVAKHFTGARAKWRKPFDDLMAQVKAFGPHVTVAPTETSYINIARKGKKFAIVQVTADRFDIGAKLKGEEPAGRFESAAGWNAMVTQRLRVTDPAQIDGETLAWLKRAYDNA